MTKGRSARALAWGGRGALALALAAAALALALRAASLTLVAHPQGASEDAPLRPLVYDLVELGDGATIAAIALFPLALLWLAALAIGGRAQDPRPARRSLGALGATFAVALPLSVALRDGDVVLPAQLALAAAVLAFGIESWAARAFAAAGAAAFVGRAWAAAQPHVVPPDATLATWSSAGLALLLVATCAPLVEKAVRTRARSHASSGIR